jgi:GAF domain-containing protein
MNQNVENFRNERAKLNERILSKDNNAAIMKRIYAMDTFAYSQRNEGLSVKQKEILGLVTSMVLRCDDCIKYHLEKCFELGVANDEMMDVFGIANVVGGTIVIPHTRRAIEYWEILLNERPSPSPFDEQNKKQRYEEAMANLDALLYEVENPISKMATINEVLKSNIPYYYWVGFYLAEKEKLTVGPYQGTHGCLFIKYGQGVCGRSASDKTTIIVDDIEALNVVQESKKGSLHITCDPRCKSEIVVPVLNKNGELIAVFDVDSLHINAFDNIDETYLGQIMEKFFGKN